MVKSRKIPDPKPLFVERMAELLTDKKDNEAFWEISKIKPRTSIRCNTLKITPQDLKQKLQDNGWQIEQPWSNYPEVMIVLGKTPTGEDSEVLINENLAKLAPGELGRSLEHQLGYFYVQELVSMLSVIAMPPKEGEMYLDLCAAPGSKTTQAAALMKNKGTIIANEMSMGRMRILASNLETCGVTNTIITKKEGQALCKKLQRTDLKFDKILVDAPCSGDGTLRDSPKTFLMWNMKTVKYLSKVQKQLFREAFRILKVGGELLYSTCTHAPEENEAVIDAMLNQFNDAIEMLPLDLPIKGRDGLTKWKDNEYNPKVKLAKRIYPQDNNTEGFFVSKFRKIKQTDNELHDEPTPSKTLRHSTDKGILPLGFMKEKEKDRFLETLNEQFGITEIPGQIVMRGKERIFLFSGDIDEKLLRMLEFKTFVERAGTYIAKKIDDEYRFSIEGSQIFKNQVTKNIVELNKEEMTEWMHGREVQKETGIKGFVMIKYQNDFIGCGKASAEKITNFIPKSRRLKDKKV